ncbi:hypothetical protein [Janthinobacterium sp. SUN137]|uniref:hypothetical protein n=1 Tax=Janthinobacterium sp. SUN137 TaxID=3014789 RepID=UPI0027134CF5|nr:hypothetical protein [Janthinobacterium sp. SUN137]MDO8038250.1 hypothetical protein [Janthinobacterium sp. SUN137]
MNMIKRTALLIASCFLAACASTDKQFPTLHESAHTAAGAVEKTLPTGEALAMLRQISKHADMAEAVYRRDLDVSERQERACDYVTATDSPPLRSGLPDGWFRLNQQLIRKLGMQPAGEQGRPLQPCRGARGLQYETYIRLDASGRPLEAVLAFRGTENTKYEWRSDWIANFSNVDFGVGANPQFSEARIEGGRLIEALVRVLPKTTSSPVCKAAKNRSEGVQAPIDLVGHSLGGGLAQHLAYSSKACDVRATIAFDPSPATGWFFLHWRGCVVTTDPNIYRVYLDGEALSFVRKVSTKFNQTRDHRRDIRMTFPDVDVGAFGRHSMTLLAAGIKYAANSLPPDDTENRIDYASSIVYPESLGQN